jgi:hypothetical protein
MDLPGTRSERINLGPRADLEVVGETSTTLMQEEKTLPCSQQLDLCVPGVCVCKLSQQLLQPPAGQALFPRRLLERLGGLKHRS